MSKKLGMECKLYVGAAVLADGVVSGSWTECTAARDVTLNLDANEADLTTRGNAGWRATRATLRDASVDFDLLWDSADGAHAATVEKIRAAYFAGTALAMAIMDGDIVISDNEGFGANWYITAFNRSEPLEEGVVISVTAKPFDHHQWYKVA